jgi:rhodanese-related sulfurtransferase
MSEIPNYAGDILPKDVFANLAQGFAGLLIDVRTQAEWSFVGVPDLSEISQEAILMQWQAYPAMQVDGEFAAKVSALVQEKGGNANTPLYFLCRSGVRSRSAAIALTQAGYTAAFNITDGFEGPTNNEGHRGLKAGWKAQGLPWRQS